MYICLIINVFYLYVFSIFWVCNSKINPSIYLWEWSSLQQLPNTLCSWYTCLSFSSSSCIQGWFYELCGDTDAWCCKSFSPFASNYHFAVNLFSHRDKALFDYLPLCLHSHNDPRSILWKILTISKDTSNQLDILPID